MRKFVVLLLSVVLILGLALSAAAIGASGSSDDVRYSALTFETIEFDGVDKYAYTLPFPFTSTFASSSDIAEFSYGDGRVYGYQGTADDDQWFPSIYGRIILPVASPDIDKYMQIYLHGGQQIFQLSRVKDYYISWSMDDLNVANIHVSGSYYRIVEREGNLYYGATFDFFDFDVPIVNGIARIGNAIYDYFLELDPDQFYIFLENISVEIDFARKSVSTTSFDFNIPVDGQTNGYPNAHIDLHNWLNLQKIPVRNSVVSEDFNLGTWLSDSIRGFLQAEIFPGFSLDKLFYCVLIIGVLVTFFKVFS